ncbi:hydroxysqualene dehydroxylase HpnE [Ectothiorhodospira mobilis]|uniref:hydroxysqualene dehydroxylase HpnE n=1 Tax=Ectothiorhodospira mobilis TaxID=195064 RepID=UPI001EE83ECF|nr:hydroxysqualene dehydroxylase HpnE [Ectothiorhodospira mobilis]MCG5535101.1 hydroxysqualene dehydroxylase HpnE [Ectothiorhodospira mobilis]
MKPAGVCVLGAGWAGLAAAVRLTQAGEAVTLLEAAPHPGGRARGVDLAGTRLDNGQHLLLGAYGQTLDLVRALGVQESAAFLRLPMDLGIRRAGAPDIGLSSLYLPTPLHLLGGLLTARGLPALARLRALPGLARLMRWQGQEDCSVLALLHRYRQPGCLIDGLWAPLCVATLNTAPERASARLFTAVLRGAFSGHRSHSDLLMPRGSLSAALPDPAVAWLQAHGARVHLGCRVQALRPQPGGGFHLALRGGDTLAARQVVLATAHPEAARLLPPLPGLCETAARLRRLQTEPICTVYLQYAESARLPTPLLGLLGTTGQWVFDRRFAGEPGRMAVVISASGPHMALDRTALAGRIQKELAAFFPDWGPPRASWVIRERQATFRAGVDCDALRPGNATPLPGLWLAGDYTATGLPGTLEGAVISGVQCAQALTQPTRGTNPTP